MTSLEDRFWLTVICAVHQTRWSAARLFAGVSLRICPCFLLLAHRWPDAWEASGCKLLARACSRSTGAARRVCRRLLKTAVARTGCCTPLLYGTTSASMNTVKAALTSALRQSRLRVRRWAVCSAAMYQDWPSALCTPIRPGGDRQAWSAILRRLPQDRPTPCPYRDQTRRLTPLDVRRTPDETHSPAYPVPSR
jgi:hypothetical protein